MTEAEPRSSSSYAHWLWPLSTPLWLEPTREARDEREWESLEVRLFPMNRKGDRRC